MDTLPYTDTVSLNNTANPFLFTSDINALTNVIIPLDNRGTELYRGVVPYNENKMFVIKVIENDNGRYVDLREWIKYGKDTHFNPSKHGLMVKASVFKEKIYPMLQEMFKYI